MHVLGMEVNEQEKVTNKNIFKYDDGESSSNKNKHL